MKNIDKDRYRKDKSKEPPKLYYKNNQDLIRKLLLNNNIKLISKAKQETSKLLNDSFSKYIKSDSNNNSTLKLNDTSKIKNPIPKVIHNHKQAAQNIIQQRPIKLKLSNSMKNLRDLKKVNYNNRTVSLSPRRDYKNTSHNCSYSNSPSNHLELPKVSKTDTKDTEREKCQKTTSTIRKASYSKDDTYNFIYNSFYNKIVEAHEHIKICDPFALIDCFIKIFDYLAINVDYKFKNINDILRVYCDPDIEVKNYKQEIDKLIEQNTILKIELEVMKNQLGKKEVICQSYIEKLKDSESYINSLKKKILMKKEVLEENKHNKDYIRDLNLELEFLREKESKLMKLIYYIHKKGFPIDTMLAGEFEEMDQSYVSCESNNTVYFPDKVKMNEKKENVPKLDFSNIPEYETIPEHHEHHKHKQDYNTEFIQNYDKYSESWRKEIDKIECFKNIKNLK
jgi:hypothetical protein